jgi:Glycosyl hydrolase family 26
VRRAHPLTAACVVAATILVVLAEGAFGGQMRDLTGVFPQVPLVQPGLPAAPQAPRAAVRRLGAVGRGTSGPPAAAPPATGSPARPCGVTAKLVPACNILWGVAPAARTARNHEAALRDFEAATGRTQAIYHAYHSGVRQLFPTPNEIKVAREPGHPRLLLINWRPAAASWAAIAAGDKRVDAFLDRLASYLRADFTEPFFLAIHHEPENDVRPHPGSGFTAVDYHNMYRHVVRRLRADGASNVVTVMIFMSYAPWNVKPWWPRLYPGDDVVDWVGWDAYALSDPGWAYGDFAEMINRTTRVAKGWPGMYEWAARHYGTKPFMIAEWGIFRSKRNPGHQAAVLSTVASQLARFPRIKAMCYFDTPNDRGRDSRVEAHPDTLARYRWLGAQPEFQVNLGPLP